MPEAAVDVDDLPQTREHQVGRAGKIADVKPITVSERMDQATDEHLRHRVFRLHRRHDAGTLGFRKDVSHWNAPVLGARTSYDTLFSKGMTENAPQSSPRDEAMYTKTVEAVREDFLEWSGGFPPDSEQMIFIFMEYALSSDVDDCERVRQMLRDWMAS
jgi:hypothetical protein